MNTDTLNHWYQKAIDVQNACNISGIIHSLSQLTDDLKAADEIRADHPTLVMWASKLDSMAGGTINPNTPCEETLEEVIAELVIGMDVVNAMNLPTQDRCNRIEIQSPIAKFLWHTKGHIYQEMAKAYDECIKVVGQ